MFHFLKIINLWSWNFVIQWSWEFNFDDLFFLVHKKKKDHDRMILHMLFLWSMIQKAVISWLWSQQILWSRDYDLRKTVILNFKIIISRDPVVLIPTISVINVILDHWKWILMCARPNKKLNTRLYWSSSDQYERHSDSPNSPPVSPPPPQVNIKNLGIQKKTRGHEKNLWNWKQKSKKNPGYQKNVRKLN